MKTKILIEIEIDGEEDVRPVVEACLDAGDLQNAINDHIDSDLVVISANIVRVGGWEIAKVGAWIKLRDDITGVVVELNNGGARVRFGDGHAGTIVEFIHRSDVPHAIFTVLA